MTSATTNRTRVAILAPEGLSGRGGIGRVLTYLMRHLRAHAGDIDVEVYPSRLSERSLLKHLSVPFALAYFAAILIVRRIQVVHINIAPRGSTWRKMVFASVARGLGRQLVLHLHGSGYNDFFAAQSPRRQDVIRRFFASSDRVVVLSPFWKRFALDQLRLDERRVVVIPNGVPAAEQRAATDAATPSLIFLGEVGLRKGVDVLLDAVALLRQRGETNWRLVVGGNGEVKTHAARAAALGLADQVEFIGWVDEARVDVLLRASDVFVLPSRAENQPVSILEAMARALPVVSTTVGAIPEQVVNGETGLLAPPGDAAALADALETLIKDPALRQRMGATGLERFRQNYSVAACGERFADLYRSSPRTRRGSGSDPGRRRRLTSPPPDGSEPGP